LRITILGKTRCVLLHFDSSKRCVCPLYKFLYTFKVVKLFLKHPVYILGFVFRQPTSLRMYISTGQEFNCVMCAVCYSSMSGYACSHLCTHCDLLAGYMWNLQVCNKLCVKGEWGLTAPSKYFKFGSLKSVVSCKFTMCMRIS
jgi:hypothetical protein